MARLIITGVLWLLSLLVLFRAPTNLLWYASILVTEFCWIFAGILCLLFFWKQGNPAYQTASAIVGCIALAIYLLPIVQAYRVAPSMVQQFSAVFGKPVDQSPFRLSKIISGINNPQLASTTVLFDKTHNLSLDFYTSQIAGKRPCVVVIHGGSWAGGNSRQLQELNSLLAAKGYHVASINYRLAPANQFPAPVEDVHSAIDALCARATELNIDTTPFTLLGRSAGGQIALLAAYDGNDRRINGVISFYGPTEMVWGYQNPTNPLVLDSRKIMEDYLGGTLQQVALQYVKASATANVTGQSPPTLLLYGNHDPLVSPGHGPRLTKKLDEKGVKYVAIYLPWATHGFDYSLNGPGGQLSTWAVLEFLRAVNQNSEGPKKK